MVNGEEVDVSRRAAPAGPETGELVIVPITGSARQFWHAGGKFVLGADTLGRDVAVRLLYGGRNSLLIGIGSALICTFLAVILALLAGYYGGWSDWAITRVFDLICAFPVILLGIALGAALSINGFHHFRSTSSRAASGSRR